MVSTTGGRRVFHRQGVARGQPGRQRRALRLIGGGLERAELGHDPAVGRHLLAQTAPGSGDEGPRVGGSRHLRRRPHGDAGAAAEIEAVGDERACRCQRQEQDVAVRPGAGDDVVVQRLQRRGDRVPGQLADHDDREPAVGEKNPGDRVARCRIGVGLGGVEPEQLVVGGRQLDELERRQRRAVALAADDELLHRAPARRGDAGEELARRRGRDVVDGDEVGLQVVELLLQRLGRRARDEQLALVAADLAPDFFRFGRQVVALVLEELGRQGGLRPGRGPGVGRFVGWNEAGPASECSERGHAIRRCRSAAVSGCASLATLRALPARQARHAWLATRRGAWPAFRASKRPARTCRCCSNHSSRPVPFDFPRVPAPLYSAVRRRGDPRRLSARSVIRGSTPRPTPRRRAWASVRRGIRDSGDIGGAPRVERRRQAPPERQRPT